MNKIQNIQQYLRLNFPILWNVKLVPALLIGVLFNLFFFGLGYLGNVIDFTKTYSYGDLWLVYFFAIIAGILSFIVWMVFYSRNNSIKRFYPMRSSDLFLEWFLSFLIIGSFALYPVSVHEGGKVRERSYVSLDEAIHGAEVLNMIAILIPEQKYQYDSRDGYSEEEGDFYSLLNYNSNEFYMSREYDVKLKGCEEVKSLLISNDKKAIKDLMNKFYALEKKHNLQSNIPLEAWFQIIYNPPTYRIHQFDQVRRSKDSYGRYTSAYYLNYENLNNSYSRIVKAHLNEEDSRAYLLTALYFALGLSVLVFSFRVTSGKLWLIALVILGVVGLLWGFLAALTNASSGVVHFLFWIGLFIYLLLDLSFRARDKRNKGKLSMLMAIFIWFLPAILLLLYGLVSSIAYSYHDWDEPSSLYQRMRDFGLTFMWLNLAFTIAIMWFASKFVRRWKSLPDE